MMEKFMNEPVEQNWIENDIIEEYEKYEEQEKSCENIWNYHAASNRNFKKEMIVCTIWRNLTIGQDIRSRGMN